MACLSDLEDFPTFSKDEVRLLTERERRAFIDQHVAGYKTASEYECVIALREAIVASRLADERRDELWLRWQQMKSRLSV